MEINGEYRIPAPRQVVWEALNDPDVLKAAITGCEELEKNEDGGFTAKVRAKVGPVSARFTGQVSIVDPDPPNGYRIEGEGKGGAAGFAKGGADVKLAEDGGETVLTYQANASVGGKLAQIGSRLIDGTAKKMADEFFAKFSEIVAERAAGPAHEHHDDGTGHAWQDAAEELAEESYDVAKHAVEDAAHAVSDAAKETAHDAAEMADAAQVTAKGVPQWMWILGAGVVILGLVIFLT